jgi:dCTP deaminase
MKLSDVTIRELCGEYELISPYREDLLNPSSYDLTWSGRIISYNQATNKWGKPISTDVTRLHRGEFYLLDTEQYFKIPDNVVGNLALKSTLAREGLNHSFSGFVDAGFWGTLTLELYLLADPIVISKGDRIAQISFDFLDRPCERTYEKVSGHYQGQFGPTKSWRK